MKKVYLFAITLFSAGALSAQMLTPTVIASTGAFSSNANGSLSYTVGEMTMVQTFTGGNNILTQGFQQPNDFVNGLLDLSKEEFGAFTVYPNPAVDNMWYGFQYPQQGRIAITLYNALGQKLSDVYQANYESGKIVEQLNVSKYASGVYFLSVAFTGNDGKVRTMSTRFQVIR